MLNLSDKASVEQYLMERVHKQESGCWLWQKCLHSGGYGVFSKLTEGKQKVYYAHRVAYELFVGPVPEGLQLDHLCRNRACCNPAHLEPVSRKENILRGEAFSAKHARKTHCPQGHEYTPENTYTRVRKGSACRTCRTCHLKADAERKKAKRMRTRLAEVKAGQVAA